ncbi:glycosyltransferase [Candidatus Uhrbacteria bacterium]|nr:glycosyltransferase [Candidatus Uhrbacteria bacterium]
MPTEKISAIIPAHNEERTVGAVVDTVRAAGFFDRIIVVSDGSHDRTAEVARQSGATVVELAKNQGKGSAVAVGLAQTDSPLACFLDADLVGLTAAYLAALAEPVLSGRWVMSVGMWDRGPVSNFLARFLPLISGQRVLRREVFEDLPPKFRSGYGMEAAMTHACRSGHLPFGRVFLPRLKIVRKFAKVGLFPGLVGYVRMFRQVLGVMVAVRLDPTRQAD